MALEPHCISVGLRGHSAALDNLLEAHGNFGFLRAEAASVIDHATGCARECRSQFEEMGLSGKQCNLVQSAFQG